MKGTHQMMWYYINTKRKDFVKDLFKAIIEETESETKIEAIKDARSYVLNNWEGIMNQYDPDYIGCSAEGHIQSFNNPDVPFSLILHTPILNCSIF